MNIEFSCILCCIKICHLTLIQGLLPLAKLCAMVTMQRRGEQSIQTYTIALTSLTPESEQHQPNTTNKVKFMGLFIIGEVFNWYPLFIVASLVRYSLYLITCEFASLSHPVTIVFNNFQLPECGLLEVTINYKSSIQKVRNMLINMPISNTTWYHSVTVRVIFWLLSD